MIPVHPKQIAPRERADCLSILLFWWIRKLLRTGWKRELHEDDIYPPLSADHSAVQGSKLECNWLKHLESCAKKKSMPSFQWTLFQTFGPKFLFYGVFAMIEECVLRIIQVVSVGHLISYFSNESEETPKNTPKTTAILACCGIIMSSFFFMVSYHWSVFSSHHVCTHMRLAVSSLIFRKVLRLSQGTMRSFSTAQLITIFSSDVHRFDIKDLHLNYIWVAPLQLIIVIYLMYFHYDFGLSSLGGLLLLVIFIVFQYTMSKYISAVRLRKIVATNRRMKIITEIMEAFYTIKLYAWENLFFQAARESRENEVKCIKKTTMLRILNTSLSLILTKMTVFLTLIFYVYYEDRQHCDHPLQEQACHLDARRVFITLLLYEHVRTNLAFLFTHAATDFAEVSVTLRRITEFLLLQEKYVNPEYYEAVIMDPNSSNISLSSNGVSMDNVVCKWHPDQELPTLDTINLTLVEGKLLAIIGPIGAGKSSLLAAILGELPVFRGKINVCGTVSYVPQTPWLFPGTVRQNITFGKMYSPLWYKEVVDICGLQADFDSMSVSDQTKVSDAGLSVGQKARISLARAVYSNSDIYLMDDPLSSVDVRLSRHILEKCIRGALKNKAVLLVTHQIHFLEGADDIAILMNGKCRAQGTFADLRAAGIEFTNEVEEIVEDDNDDDVFEELVLKRPTVLIVEEEDETHNLVIKELIPSAQRPSQPHTGSVVAKSNIMVKDIEASDEKYDTIRPDKIGLGLYWSYTKASSSWFLISCLLILCILFQALFSGSDYWLEFWTEDEEHRALDKDFPSKGIHSQHLQITIYCSLIPALVVVSVFRSIAMFKICINSSSTLFCQMLYSLLHAKALFMETNCVGQGINRFAKDLIVVDEHLPITLYELTGVIFEILGAATILSYLNQWFLIPCITYLVLIYLLYKVYHKTASGLKRIECNARTPVYAHTTKTLQGLSTIRAYEQEQTFLKIFENLQDTHTGSWYLYLATHAWLAVTVDFLSILLISAVTLTYIFVEDAEPEPAKVGLAIAKVIELSILGQVAVTAFAHSETEMISVERILEYTRESTESAWEIPSKKPPDYWPHIGHIVFKNIFLEGFGNRMLLRDLNCEILPGEKIGVVGRSGSGKSALINALFRVTEPTYGTIELDDIDIHTLGLHDLRKKISVIPQIPHLFIGTLRKNLDPFNEHVDMEIWAALEEVCLFDAVKMMGGGLDTEFTETGWQFSAGQSQLMSLARAMLKNNQVLCCDEPTALLDPQTQTVMLKKIREHFSKCTVIIIAHRIHSIVECDKILVIEEGHIVDYGPPYELITQNGPFQELVDQMGRKNAEEIKRLAKEASTRKINRRKSRAYSVITSLSKPEDNSATATASGSVTQPNVQKANNSQSKIL